MGFVLFENATTYGVGKYITVYKRTLCSSSMAGSLLDGFTYVEIYIDNVVKAIKLVGTNTHERNRKITRRGKRFYISCSISKVGIPLGRYFYDEEEKVFIFNKNI